MSGPTPNTSSSGLDRWTVRKDSKIRALLSKQNSVNQVSQSTRGSEVILSTSFKTIPLESSGSSYADIKPYKMMANASEKYPSTYESAKVTDMKKVKQMLAETSEKYQGHTIDKELDEELIGQCLTQIGQVAMSHATDRRMHISSPPNHGNMKTLVDERSIHKAPINSVFMKKPIHHLRPYRHAIPPLSVPGHITHVSHKIKSQSSGDGAAKEKEVKDLGKRESAGNLLRSRIARKKQHKVAVAKQKIRAQILHQRLEQAAGVDVSMRQKKELDLIVQDEEAKAVWFTSGMFEKRQKVKVIVIGADLAGLSTAAELYRLGFTNVQVLEATERIGGRLRTIHFNDVHGDKGDCSVASVELGEPAWVTDDPEDTVFTLAEESNLLCQPTYPRPQCKVISPDGRVLHDWIVSTALRFWQHTERDACFLYNNVLSSERRKKSSLAFSDFSRRRRRHMLFDISTEGSKDLSCALDAVEGLWRCAAGDETGDMAADLVGFHASTRSPAIGQSELPDDHSEPKLPRVKSFTKRGYLAREMVSKRRLMLKSTCSLLTTLAKHLPKSVIKFKERACRFDWSEFCSETMRQGMTPEVKLTVRLLDKTSGKNVCKGCKTYAADHIIVALSLGHLKKSGEALFHPNLPKDKQEAMQRVGVGTVSTILLHYNPPLQWHSAFNLLWVGDNESSDPASLSSNWMQIATSHSSLHVIEVTILGDIPSRAAADNDHVASEVWEVIRRAHSDIISKNVPVPVPEQIIRSNWSHDPIWNGTHPYLRRGCYVDDIRCLSDPIMFRGKPVIQFAGDYTWPDYSRQMHAARASGLREAQRLANFYDDFLGYENIAS